MSIRGISERLVRQRLHQEESINETVVVDGNWYWRFGGKCYTQPTDKSESKKEISEEEYRDILYKSKNGVTDIPTKKSSDTVRIVPEDVQKRMNSLEDTKPYFDDEESFKQVEKLYHETAGILGVSAEDLVSDNLDYSDNVSKFEELISNSKVISTQGAVGKRSYTKVYQSPEGVKFAVHRSDNYEHTIFIPKKSPATTSSKDTAFDKSSQLTKSKKLTPTSWESKFKHAMRQHEPLPKRPKSSPSSPSANTWRNSSDAVEKLALDDETVATVSGRLIIVDLGDKDLRNKELTNKLKELGYKQSSNFRWVYES